MKHYYCHYTLHGIFTGVLVYVERMSECRKYFLKAMLGYLMENVGLDDTEWEEKIICKGLMDICLLAVSGWFVLNCSYL